MVELEPDSLTPARKKMSKFVIEVMEQEGYFAIGYADFDMVNFNFGKYKEHTLPVKLDSDMTELLGIS